MSELEGFLRWLASHEGTLSFRHEEPDLIAVEVAIVVGRGLARSAQRTFPRPFDLLHEADVITAEVEECRKALVNRPA